VCRALKPKPYGRAIGFVLPGPGTLAHHARSAPYTLNPTPRGTRPYPNPEMLNMKPLAPNTKPCIFLRAQVQSLAVPGSAQRTRARRWGLLLTTPGWILEIANASFRFVILNECAGPCWKQETPRPYHVRSSTLTSGSEACFQRIPLLHPGVVLIKVAGAGIDNDTGVYHVGRDVGIFLPNSQCQHHTLHVQKDVLPYALC